MYYTQYLTSTYSVVQTSTTTYSVVRSTELYLRNKNEEREREQRHQPVHTARHSTAHWKHWKHCHPVNQLLLLASIELVRRSSSSSSRDNSKGRGSPTGARSLSNVKMSLDVTSFAHTQQPHTQPRSNHTHTHTPISIIKQEKRNR